MMSEENLKIYDLSDCELWLNLTLNNISVKCIVAVLSSPYMSLAVAKYIATALVSIILDYCNSILHNIISKDVAQFQNM